MDMRRCAFYRSRNHAEWKCFFYSNGFVFFSLLNLCLCLYCTVLRGKREFIGVSSVKLVKLALNYFVKRLINKIRCIVR
jgi:hypothetical protein